MYITRNNVSKYVVLLFIWVNNRIFSNSIMGYIIDVSFDIRKTGQVTSLQKTIIDCANECECSSSYIEYELEGKRRTIYRNSCVITVVFAEVCEDNFLQILTFLNTVSSLKNVYVESIYCDWPPHFVHTTSKYVNMMTNLGAKKEVRRKNRTYSDEDLQLLKAISK